MGSVANGASPFMSQPQNSVDMLGELPDIDFFSIPGDRSVMMRIAFAISALALTAAIYLVSYLVLQSASFGLQSTTFTKIM